MSHSYENVSVGARDALRRMLKSPNFFPESKRKSDQYLSYQDKQDHATVSRIWKNVIEKEKKIGRKVLFLFCLGYSYKTISRILHSWMHTKFIDVSLIVMLRLLGYKKHAKKTRKNTILNSAGDKFQDSHLSYGDTDRGKECLKNANSHVNMQLT